MGNSSTKESRTPSISQSRPSSLRRASSSNNAGISAASGVSQTPGDRLSGAIYGSRSGRGSRHDLSFLGIGGSSEREVSASEARRETRQEREVRKLEKEKLAREKERERSMREESVDGGYLVTLGTYTGPEDFNKDVVRQLMVERRLAPFWKGLNDHTESWTENQLVAAVRGLPIPAADEVSPAMARTASQASSNPRSSDLNINNLTVPMTSRSQSYQSDKSASLSPSHAAFSGSPLASSMNPPPSTSNLLRGRAKTLASVTTYSKSNQPSDTTLREIQLQKDPYVNGLPLEAYLYKDVLECPICFLCYPPYLNKTRCCDQPICSECFVQIKRPDPHPPEHHGDAPTLNAAETPSDPEEDGALVSEVAACPFCVQPEFGVTYDSPPFRRGLVYMNQGPGTALASARSAMSSSSSLDSQIVASPAGSSRRRATSLAANAPTVITTDRVRPDWAKKLSDARAHALRRSAAATALHNAAYVIGNGQGLDVRGFGLGRRRRTLFGGDSPSSSGRGTPQLPDGLTLSSVGPLLAHAERRGSSSRDGNIDLYPGRSSSRRNRMEDLEELMMMEAIRLSLAAEDDRKKKEGKEVAKEAKKEEKKKAKEAKRAEKAAKKSGLHPYLSSANGSGSLLMSRSSSGLGQQPAVEGKGKAPASAYVGFNPLTEPTSTLNTEAPSPVTSTAAADASQPQFHGSSKAQLQPQKFKGTESSAPSHLRQISSVSSSSSSLIESVPGSLRLDSSFNPSPSTSGVNIPCAYTSTAQEVFRSGTPPGGGAGTESMFNFSSLTAMIREEDKDPSEGKAEHIENVEEALNPSVGSQLRNTNLDLQTPNRLRGDSGESSSSAPPPSYEEGGTLPPDNVASQPGEDEIVALKKSDTDKGNPYDVKHCGDVNVLDAVHGRQAA
ncbi:hypothetical protein LTR04_006672 [Oleoguttula sp. CCFEE 6159]|nr:hypothetical protein LTR04_006672 [Oleoguttula sp. CCFEE 6159]